MNINHSNPTNQVNHGSDNYSFVLNDGHDSDNRIEKST
jgi:hypothetical protein